MDERYTIQRLLTLRKLTRAIADVLRAQMAGYMATLAPLLRPRTVLGEFVQGAGKDPVRGAAKAFEDLKALYRTASRAKPFGLATELAAPLEVTGATFEMTPVEYGHRTGGDGAQKVISITMPFKWVVTPAGFGPERLRDLLRDPDRAGDELHRFVLQYVMLHVVVARQTGVTQILEALHFPVTSGKVAGLGELPVTFVAAAIPTLRPPDEVIIESTEVSGLDAFQEVVDVAAILQLRDPLRERLIDVVRSHGEDLLPAG